MSRYTIQSAKGTRPSQAIEESKRKASLLKDNSWIRKDEEEDEPVDRDPNFGRTVLSRYKSNESLTSPEPEEPNKTTKRVTASSVQALSKRFSGSQDELRSSTLPTSKTTSPYAKSSYSSVKSPTTTTTTKTTVKEEPKTSTKTTAVTKDGKTTETTTTTTTTSTTSTQSVKSPVTKTPTKTETFTERVKSSSKGTVYSNYSPTKTTKVTEKTVVSTKDAEDKLFDTLIPTSVKDDSPPTDSKTTVSTTETVTVKSSPSTQDAIKTTTTTKTSSTAKDDQYDTLLPRSITSGVSSPVSSHSDYTPTSRTSSYTISSKPSAEDKLYDTLIPDSIQDDVKDSKTTVTSTETVTVKSTTNGDGTKTSTTTRTSSTAEDDLYSTLLPKSITSDLSSPVRGESPFGTSSSTRSYTSYSSYNDDSPTTRNSSYTISTKPSDTYSSDRRSYSYSKPDSSYEYTSVSSPTSYTSSSYSTKRPVLEKDLCTYCHKPFTGDAKMVLDDMKINCHASCFKCHVCNSDLGNLKAGDSMWIYKSMVHCENCFEVTRDKWRR